MQALTIVSYNIHKGLSAGNRRHVLQQIRAALAATDPDLVLLQEIVGAHARHARRFPDWSPHPQAQVIAESLWPHTVYGRSAEHVHGDHGNAILSKLPVRVWQNVDCSVNRWEQRAILHAVLERDDGPPVHVCCVHLNLRQADRRLQIAQLVQLVRSCVPDDEPLIIGGDFNDWREQAGEMLCAALGVVDAHVAHVGRHARTFPAWRPLLPLDRIYCRGFEVERVEVLNGLPWRGMSDHLAIAARLHLQ